MNRLLFGAICAIGLSACSGGETGQQGPEAPRSSVDDPVPAAEDVAEADPQALEIGVMHVTNPDAYCTLMQAGHEFVYDDRGTWKFVFLTAMMGDPQPATIRINGEDVHFDEESRTEDADGLETWQYRSGNREILVELKLRAVDGGQEHTDYEGTMAIIEPAETEKMGVEGSCGV